MSSLDPSLSCCDRHHYTCAASFDDAAPTACCDSCPVSGDLNSISDEIAAQRAELVLLAENAEHTARYAAEANIGAMVIAAEDMKTAYRDGIRALDRIAEHAAFVADRAGVARGSVAAPSTVETVSAPAKTVEVEVLRARIGSALTWIERHRQKWGELTIELDSIRDSLLGVACVDATPGATSSDRFAAGVAAPNGGE